MKKGILSSALASMCALACAQAHRALIITINNWDRPSQPVADAWYSSESIHNLEGPINDSKAIEQALIVHYGFEKGDFVELHDEEATRTAILAALDQLAKDAQPGERILIYYSGHGGLIPNTLSDKNGGKASTIIPADALEGAHDITDKEIGEKLNNILDKFMTNPPVVTAIFDSCHSGSMARGWDQRTPKFAPSKPEASVSFKDFGENQAPQEHGALILSACQFNELAADADDLTTPMGAFTSAFVDSISESNGQADVSSLIAACAAKLSVRGYDQHPEVEGMGRLAQGLTGDPATGFGGSIIVNVQSRLDAGVVLQGGRAAGVESDTILQGVDGKGKAADVRIKVTITELLTSSAIYFRGNKDLLGSTDRFRVVRWGVPPVGALRLFVPRTTQGEADLLALSSQSGLGAALGQDPLALKCNVEVYWGGTGWKARSAGGAELDLGATPDVAKVAGLTGRDPAVASVALPLAREISDKLTFDPSGDALVSASDSDKRFDYILTGRIKDGSLQYAWTLAAGVAGGKDSHGMPIRSDWIKATDPAKTADGLKDEAKRLARLKNWLNLEDRDSPGAFPYELRLRAHGTTECIPPGQLVSGKSYDLVLKRKPGEWGQDKRENRFVYVMNMGCTYDAEMLYPDSRHLGGNQILASQNDDVILLRTFNGFQAPFGTERFVLVTSDQELPNPRGVFTFSGFDYDTRSGDRGSSNPLQALLQDANEGTRLAKPDDEAPESWCVRTVEYKSGP